MPSDDSHLELLSQLDITALPKPFRNPNFKPAQRRNRTIKQIVSDASKRELATQSNSGTSTPAGQTGTASTPNPANGPLQPANILAAAQNLSRLVLERNLQASGPAPTYTNIESAPSLHPALQKRFCDITGLPSSYTDPKTRLRYHDKEVFGVIRGMTSSAIEGHLEARAAQAVLK